MTRPPAVSKGDFKRLAAKLRKRRWSRALTSTDPRLGGTVEALAPGAETARTAAELLSEDTKGAKARRTKAAQVRELISRADACRRLPLVPEFESIADAVLDSPRAVRALELRLGLDGGGPRTLSEVGRRLGVSRERVRQFESRFTERTHQRDVWAPSLKRAFRRVKSTLPLSELEAVELLREEGLLREQEFVPVASLVGLGELFGLKVPFEEIGGCLVPPGTAKSAADLGTLARKLTASWGALTVSELVGVLAEVGKGQLEPAVARCLLGAVDGVRWLDAEREWLFISETKRNRLSNHVTKILAVAGSISLADLRDGVGRHHRMHGFRPPREVLARFCEEFGYERVGDEILGGAKLPDWQEILGENECRLVSILFEDGPVMRREDLERRAVDEEGMNRNSFYAYLSYSPVLERYAPGVYGLRGASVRAAEIKAMIPPRVRRQVLKDYGWTDDGKVWIAYKVSPASLLTGVLSVPAVLDALLEGSYSLVTEDEHAVGTVVVEDNLWGLSPYFKRRGIEAGDYLVLVFDTTHDAATVATGGEELLVRFQKAE